MAVLPLEILLPRAQLQPLSRSELHSVMRRNLQSPVYEPQYTRDSQVDTS